MDRAQLQANDRGYEQAQQAAGQDFARSMNLATTAPALAGQQISALTTLGGLQQGWSKRD